jgi:hypothetical protein
MNARIRAVQLAELRAATFEEGLLDSETQDDAFRVAEALAAYCPRTEQTGEIFAAFARVVAKARARK